MLKSSFSTDSENVIRRGMKVEVFRVISVSYKHMQKIGKALSF